MRVILDVYSEVVVPWWAAKTVPLVCNPELAVGLKLIKASNLAALKKDLEGRLGIYFEWEKKQSQSTEKII